MNPTASLFQENLAQAEQAHQVLEYSYAHLHSLAPLNVKQLQALPAETLEDLDALTIRFARLQDLMGKRLFRGLALLEAEEQERFLDLLALMEKRGLLEMEQWLQIRTLRNQIAHEYLDQPETFVRLLNQLFEMIPLVIAIYQRLLHYLNEKALLR